MATYKTPDVYVEEISLYPPSVAEVETAIPAFIGYTANVDRLGPGDLKNRPIKVASLLEYEELFGGGPPVGIGEILLDENNALASYDTTSSYYMYDSLRLFFKNGGGGCYIVSIGSYDDAPARIDFDGGLNAIRKKDEPTIILFPDAVFLDAIDLHLVQQAALKQCAELGDRVAVFDLIEKKANDNAFGWANGVDEFRSNIGINYLKYGAAYTPWLKTSLGVAIKYRDVIGKINQCGSPVGLDALTDAQEVKDNVVNLDGAMADVDRMHEDRTLLEDGQDSLKAKYVQLQASFKTNPDVVGFKALFTFVYDIAEKIDTWAGSTNPLACAGLLGDLRTLITDSLLDSMTTLIGYDKGAKACLTEYGEETVWKGSGITIGATEWIGIAATNIGAINSIVSIYNVADNPGNSEKMTAAEPYVLLIFNQINAAVAEIAAAAGNYESTYEDNLLESHVIYKNIIRGLSGGMTTLPPSGAIAGVYAMVDGARGVWKAPANVSLSGVAGVTEVIDNKEQEDLNVDVADGKSINAIRPFTGKGILVWGARTLAGNDNEWRYVSVRRFFNMVEESIKKSTYWAVFEPNDANTWIKVKSMIENYLTQKWRDGALAGSKPAEAFFVDVGLGKTMTARDILEGRMIVEIGMAAVRPAEFIILKFSHKMQES